jgi:predicted dehydrogenase
MDKVRIGIIGVAGRGTIAEHWHKSKRAVVVAGADVNEAHLAGFKSRIGDHVTTTTDYRELLDRKDIDAIAVLSPDYCHEEQAVASLQAGKHVFCEKPLAITTEGCDNILKAWKSSNRHLMVGFNMRYMNIFRVMKDIADSGAIGTIKAVWVRHFVGYGGDFYYHDWHATRKNTTSLLLQKGSHDIDMIHWITGRYTSRVAAFGGLDFFGGDRANDLTCPDCPDNRTCTEALFGTRTQCAFRQEVDVEDNNVVIMELEGGIKASYLQCHFTPDYHRNYVFIGTEGRMENSEPEGKVWVKTRRVRERPDVWRELADRTYEIKKAVGGHGGADPVICEDFLDMILLGKEPVATPIAGRMSVAAGCAAAESMRNGGIPVDIPPVNV